MGMGMGIDRGRGREVRRKEGGEGGDYLFCLRFLFCMLRW